MFPVVFPVIFLNDGKQNLFTAAAGRKDPKGFPSPAVLFSHDRFGKRECAGDESELNALPHEGLLNFADVDISRFDAVFDGDGGRGADSLTDVHADRHDTEIGVGLVGSGDIASGKEESVDFFGDAGAIGEGISSF